jgi:protein pelota
MKLCGKVLEKDSSGSIKLIAEEPEDMWHIYNILARGDQLYCSTVRYSIAFVIE